MRERAAIPGFSDIAAGLILVKEASLLWF